MCYFLFIVLAAGFFLSSTDLAVIYFASLFATFWSKLWSHHSSFFVVNTLNKRQMQLIIIFNFINSAKNKMLKKKNQFVSKKKIVILFEHGTLLVFSLFTLLWFCI